MILPCNDIGNVHCCLCLSGPWIITVHVMSAGVCHRMTNYNLSTVNEEAKARCKWFADPNLALLLLKFNLILPSSHKFNHRVVLVLRSSSTSCSFSLCCYKICNTELQFLMLHLLLFSNDLPAFLCIGLHSSNKWIMGIHRHTYSRQPNDWAPVDE